jgi:hypothetical protein
MALSANKYFRLGWHGQPDRAYMVSSTKKTGLIWHYLPVCANNSISAYKFSKVWNTSVIICGVVCCFMLVMVLQRSLKSVLEQFLRWIFIFSDITSRRTESSNFTRWNIICIWVTSPWWHQTSNIGRRKRIKRKLGP